MQVFPLDPFLWQFWSMVGSAILCGAIIGLERQLRGKPAGVRTSCLICLSTAVFLALGRTLAGPDADTTRVLGQVVTGVGFLGAGVMLARGGVVTGVTTASVIWTLACIGSTVGLGYPRAAIGLSIVTVAILTGVELLESGFRRLKEGVYSREHR